MNIRSYQLKSELGPVKMIGEGSTGQVYCVQKFNNVLKIYFSYLPVKSSEEILKFSDVQNDTFIWPSDVLTVDKVNKGYFSKYVKGRNLSAINPLIVNLEDLKNAVASSQKDVKLLSDNGIQVYDVMYNIMYNKDGLFVIDTDDFIKSSKDSKSLQEINSYFFNVGIREFLIDNYFDEFVKENKFLKEMYQEKNIDIIEFMTYFKRYLEEHVGSEIQTLGQASMCLNRKLHEPNYLRG